MKQIRCLVLDLDGTIVDTLSSLQEAVNLALEKNGLPQRSEEEVRVAIGNGVRLLVQRSLPSSVAKDESYVSKVLADFCEMYDTTYDHLNGDINSFFTSFITNLQNLMGTV